MTLYAWARPRRFPDLPAGCERYFDVAPDARVLAHCHWQATPREHPTLIVLHGQLPHLSGPNRSPKSRHAYTLHVIDGACRDTHLCRELNYPIYSRSYSMRTGKDRVQVEAMNVVVGKPGWNTPVFADTVRHLVVNPSWTPPPSIVKEEILPAVARDPSYLSRHGFIRTRNGGFRQ